MNFKSLTDQHHLFFFFLMIPPPPRSTLFPYPTLFRSIAVDGAGNAFVAGQTLSADFPGAANNCAGASFVAELDPTGTNLLYATYLAGSTTGSGKNAFGIAVDPSGKVYVTGVTFATDFPTTSAKIGRAHV